MLIYMFVSTKSNLELFAKLNQNSILHNSKKIIKININSNLYNLIMMEFYLHIFHVTPYEF